MFFVYRVLINLIVLIAPIILLIRIVKNKEDKKRFKEKFCFFTHKRKKGKLIWFHGSSVGEILSIIPLLEKLEHNSKIGTILITSSTLSSSKVLSKFKFKKTIHQFFPIDADFLIKKFLSYWKPSLAIFIESEIWPNAIININKKSIPLILLNARITKKSFQRWKKISFSPKLFEIFNICFPQNFETKKYLHLLGAKKIKMLGNLKFSESELNNKYELKISLKKYFSKNKIWCASSTHNTEEAICGLTHKKLKLKHKNLLTVIIPRHLQRIDDIKNQFKNLNLNVHMHSSKNKIKRSTDIYLVDTYGETKTFFKVCKTVFLGGSLIKHGGQNPLEAARYGCEIIHGPNINNFTEIYALLKKINLSFKVKNTTELVNKVDKSLFKNLNSSKKINKLKKIGVSILKKNYSEVNNYI
jgi:3-deoxy-D-manno-octulosonic-acid transferase